jgi:hypothetical protein
MSTETPAGYSGKPLAAKLGFRGPVYGHDVPAGVRAAIDAVEPVAWVGEAAGARDAHLFVTMRAELEDLLARMRRELPGDAIVWVSWPKKASKVPTDMTEDVIRAVALPMGWVDVKVCAVDQIWSGLKLVVRKELRKELTLNLPDKAA